MKDFNELIGKKITGVKVLTFKEFDDAGYLLLTLDNKERVIISSTYGGYTGGSLDEYPTIISVISIDKFKDLLSDDIDIAELNALVRM